MVTQRHAGRHISLYVVQSCTVMGERYYCCILVINIYQPPLLCVGFQLTLITGVIQIQIFFTLHTLDLSELLLECIQ